MPSRPVVLRELSLWLAGRRQRVQVEGASMEPTLTAGEYVLVDPSSLPAEGDVVVLDHPNGSGMTLVKRVSNLAADGTAVVLSDNKAVGIDSRTFGPVSVSELNGVVRVSLSRLAAI